MDNETLDRMVDAMTDTLGIDAFSLADVNIQDARRGMLAALRSMWRPIEEAPKDGTWLLLTEPSLPCGADEYVDVGRFDCSGWYTADNAPLYPLYFTPLLPGPEE